MTSFDTAAAIAQANKWTEAGAHLVRALMAVDAAQNGMADITGNGVIDAKASTVTAKYALECGLLDLRSDAVGIEMPDIPIGGDESEWSAREVICAEIEAGVISVGALIKKMEMEA